MFNPLGREQLEKIVDMQLASVSKRLADRQVQIELTPSARALILAEGYDPGLRCTVCCAGPCSDWCKTLSRARSWKVGSCQANDSGRRQIAAAAG